MGLIYIQCHGLPTPWRLCLIKSRAAPSLLCLEVGLFFFFFFFFSLLCIDLLAGSFSPLPPPPPAPDLQPPPSFLLFSPYLKTSSRGISGNCPLPGCAGCSPPLLSHSWLWLSHCRGRECSDQRRSSAGCRRLSSGCIRMRRGCCIGCCCSHCGTSPAWRRRRAPIPVHTRFWGSWLQRSKRWAPHFERGKQPQLYIC